MRIAIDRNHSSRRARVLATLFFALLSIVFTTGQLFADDFDCFDDANCSVALESSTTCLEPGDYATTTSDVGSNVTVLSIHGGFIETDTSTISQELASRYGWNRYDFDGHGTSACLAGRTQSQRLHITATHFDDPDALNLVGAHANAVAVHGYSTSRGYPRGTLCVGGGSAAQRLAFINHVNSNKAAFESSGAGYTITPVNAPLISTGNCSDLTGTATNNIVNRTTTGGGLQLELHKDLRDDLADLCNESYEPLRELIFGATAVAMGETPVSGKRGYVYERLPDGSIGPKISGVQITYRDESNCLEKTVTSTSFGFHSAQLPARRYVVTATHPDFADYSTAPGFAVVTGGGFQTFNIFMTRTGGTPPGGSVDTGKQGRVFERNSDGSIGANISGATLTFVAEDNSLIDTVTSGVGGSYRIDLPPGRYVATVTHPSFHDYSTAPGFAVVNSTGYGTFNIFLTRK